MVRVSGNTNSSPLFNASRDRSQTLLITLGDVEGGDDGKDKKKKLFAGREERGISPTPSAALFSSHFASEVGLSVANAVRNSQ
jgi:hypothetical protein